MLIKVLSFYSYCCKYCVAADYTRVTYECQSWHLYLHACSSCIRVNDETWLRVESVRNVDKGTLECWKVEEKLFDGTKYLLIIIIQTSVFLCFLTLYNILKTVIYELNFLKWFLGYLPFELWSRSVKQALYSGR